MKVDGLMRVLLETVGHMKLKDLPIGDWTVADMISFMSGIPALSLPKALTPKPTGSTRQQANSGPQKAKTRKIPPPKPPKEAVGTSEKRKKSLQMTGRYMGLMRSIESARDRIKIKRIAKTDGLQAAIAFMEQMRSRRS